ncbi:hypothetical protein YQE_04688, partial [Dendroctonus ponderosae]
MKSKLTELCAMNNNNPGHNDFPDDIWNNIKQNILAVFAAFLVPTTTTKKNKPWMTDEIFSLMENRRIKNPVDLCSTWKRYAQLLFEDQREARQPINGEEWSGPEILESEVQHALKAMQTRKSPGHDYVHAEKCYHQRQDVCMLHRNLEDLQQIMDRIEAMGKSYDLKINATKAKLMVIGRQPIINTALTVDGNIIERVSRLKYLGAMINERWDCDEEVKLRTNYARTTICKHKNFLLTRSLPLALRLRVVKCYIWSILLYGAETWSLKARTLNRIEAFEMWTLRRLLRVPWTAHATNKEILRTAGCEREILNIVKERKVFYLGHILREMNVGDHSGNQWISMFNDECEKVLGLSSQAAGELMEANNDAFTDVIEQAQFQEFILKCRVKMETYN